MLSWFDIIILTIITISSLLGIYGGLIKLVIGLLGFITSIIITYYLSPYISNIVAEYLTNFIPLMMVSIIISYIISLIICSLLTHKFITMLAVISKGMVDRSLGLIFGFIRGIAICMLLFKILTILLSGSYLEAKTLKDVFQNDIMDKYPNWLQSSITIPYLNELNKNLIDSGLLTKLETIKFKKASSINVLEKSHSPKSPPKKKY